MLEIMKYLKARYLSNEKAQGMVEYALVLALVVVIGVAVFGSDGTKGLGKVISDAFTAVGNKLSAITQ